MARQKKLPILDYRESVVVTDTTGTVVTKKSTGELAPRLHRFGEGCRRDRRSSPACPYCGARSHVVLSEVIECHPRSTPFSFAPIMQLYDPDEGIDVLVRACSSCGWWYAEYHIDWIGAGLRTVYAYDDIEHYSTLRTFDPSDYKLPVDVLREELARRPGVVHDIHSMKFEELVGGVLRDIYPDHEVRVCGRTGDGGIDLVVAAGEELIAFQVKRRISPEAVEGVRGVREFFGACMLADIDEGIYVTTADHFTKGATELAQLIESRRMSRFGLVDRGFLFDLLKRTENSSQEPWAGVISGLRDQFSE